MKKVVAAILLCAISASAQSKTADKKFWVVTVASFASTIADEEITQYAIRTHPLREANPILGQTRKSAYPVLLGIGSASTYLSYRLKKNGSDLWYVPQAFVIGSHSFGVTWNLAMLRK
jgi:hypothetical protein